MSRFDAFSEDELDAISDGLLGEAELNPHEDESFPARIAVAQALLYELERQREETR